MALLALSPGNRNLGYCLSYVSTVLLSSASPSCDPCLRGARDRDNNYFGLYKCLRVLLLEVSESFHFDVVLRARIHYTSPKQVLVLVIIIAQVPRIFKCFSSSLNVEVDDLALSFYCQLLNRPVLD